MVSQRSSCDNGPPLTISGFHTLPRVCRTSMGLTRAPTRCPKPCRIRTILVSFFERVAAVDAPLAAIAARDPYTRGSMSNSSAATSNRSLSSVRRRTHRRGRSRLRAVDDSTFRLPPYSECEHGSGVRWGDATLRGLACCRIARTWLYSGSCKDDRPSDGRGAPSRRRSGGHHAPTHPLLRPLRRTARRPSGTLDESAV